MQQIADELNRILKYLVIGSLAAFALGGCRDFSFTSFMRGDVVASVGEQKLYTEDVRSLFTGLTPDDSLKLLQSYVEKWVKQQLKTQQAEKMSPQAGERIERMVEEYRRSLLIYEYEKAYIDQRLDTVVTADEIRAYYDSAPDRFRLAVPLIKGVVVRFPAGFRQEGQMRLMALSGQSDRIQDMIDIAVKNNFSYREFTDWTEAGNLTVFLPRLSETENERLLRSPGLFETTQGEHRYFVAVTGLLSAGSPMPLERAAETIRTLIVTRRRQELVRTMEEELLHEGIRLKEVTIHVDTVKIENKGDGVEGLAVGAAK